MQLIEFAIHITIAVILGAAIGVERQWRQRQAGLRTNALVSSGAAAFVAVSLLVEGATDPTRVLAQVVSGIGFLGGGIILREGLNVRGLNTAATLWCSAAVGSLAGMGYLLPALVTTAIVLGTNVLLRPAAMLINRAPVEQATEVDITYRIEITCREAVEQHIRALLLQETASDAGSLWPDPFPPSPPPPMLRSCSGTSPVLQACPTSLVRSSSAYVYRLPDAARHFCNRRQTRDLPVLARGVSVRAQGL